ncbi:MULTISPECIES: motility protein A [Caproicibacterium]|uniref:MotA/TolQ/ExbB proton channel family protein n=1 Tax=Caproicibacterium argilliputei TaxID=3030016 RepID=A0AA97H476_9FIRM|nr:MotA/TolQ/ExbB proton channel family protein [Caproicibacterium argilliputei]WOC33108.1 MotA/TolQ/ExbB proton channel family protein [Caproicibacterium argilliputei]
MDISLIIGLVVAFGSAIGGFLLDGGKATSLVVGSSFLIVVGGTMGATIISFGISGTLKAFKRVFFSYNKKNEPNPEHLIEKISEMTNKCRSDGLLVLQSMLSDPELETENYLMLKEAMVLATDAKSVEVLQDTLSADIESYSAAMQQDISVLEGAGGFSPTLGIIGTVMGLVQVLSNISDASKLTASIAVAFIATLYGIVFANLLYLPFANHLRSFMKRQVIFREMMVDGICMMVSGESTRNIQNKLSLYYHAFPNCEDKYKAGIDN